ncbi:MAG: hypothetical protein H7293_02320 [Candidatus Saccharibacteria bacterium]|nr:hypothetical protein [Rhodoferax sp.]
MHFHLSITDVDGTPMSTDAQGGWGLNQLGHQFAAVLLHHADAVTAWCAPKVNSYKRLASGASASGTIWSPIALTKIFTSPCPGYEDVRALFLR